MSSNILSYVPASQPSLCIPRVFATVTEDRILRAFEELNIAKIHHIDFIKESDKFNRVYIHMDKWYWNENAVRCRTMLLNGEDIKVVYDAPWFWKISASKKSTPKAHIDFGDDDSSKKRKSLRDAPKLATPPSKRATPSPKFEEDLFEEDERKKSLEVIEEDPDPAFQPIHHPLVPLLRRRKFGGIKKQQDQKKEEEEEEEEEDKPYEIDELYADIYPN
jgi:hypothetical protein